MTVRERVAEIQRAVRDEDLPPSRLRELSLELVGLYGNCNAEVTDAEIAYAHVLAACYGQEAKANRAKLRAETSDEYRRVRVARDTQRLVLEMTRTLRQALRSVDEEMRMTR